MCCQAVGPTPKGPGQNRRRPGTWKGSPVVDLVKSPLPLPSILGLFLVISQFLFPGCGSKLRHEEEGNSELLGGPSSSSQESQQRFHPCSSHPHTSRAAVQTGRESLSCIFPGAGFGYGQERPNLGRKQWVGGGRLQVGGGG